LDLLSLLLKDFQVDPSIRTELGVTGDLCIEILHAHLQQALHKASAGGHLEIVKLLLNEPRVDPSSKDSNHSTRI
jgi:hypothetical protein